MYHTVLPVTNTHDPIIVEGQVETQLIVFNAGPSVIEAQVWQNWKGKVDGRYQEHSEEPNLRLELRAGNQRIVSGSFVRVRIKDMDAVYSSKEQFAAIGVRVTHIDDESYYL